MQIMTFESTVPESNRVRPNFSVLESDTVGTGFKRVHNVLGEGPSIVTHETTRYPYTYPHTPPIRM